MQLIPASPVIVEQYLDFGKAAEYARQSWRKIPGLSKTKHCWKESRLHFLTESVQPTIATSGRPKVMLLFSNPHPDSVERGLFMSESHARGFWDILSNSIQPKMNHDFHWDPSGITETVSMLANGDYEGPLMFLECLYQLPSRSPKDLRNLFDRKTDDFQTYIHRPSLERISSIINKHNISVVLVFTGETYESVVDKPKVSKGSREVLHACVKENLSDGLFWEFLEKRGLKDKVRLPYLNHDCTAIKIMDTRAKTWWQFDGRSTFSHVLSYGLRYATEFG